MEEPKNGKMTGIEQYNVIADTVTGVNIHFKDNMVQLISCIIGLVLGGIIGFIFGKWIGLGVGCFVGLISGTLISGFYIMIYRLIMHAKGQHK